jgi:excisionase family DNA binding protein
VDIANLISQIESGNVIALIPNPRAPEPTGKDTPALGKRWYSPQEVADMLGFGIYKVKMLLITREMRSIKDGKYRRILPEWVDEYVARRVEEANQ